MTWLTGTDWNPTPPGERFAQLLAAPGVLSVPGAHDAMSGLLARRAGFKCLYVSGAAVTASMGMPDLGVMTLEELCFFTRTIYRATQLPLIVDGDTGYGEVLNVMRTIRELEAAGAAAIQIEDQVLPKKCGHLNDKQLQTPDDAARKIEAARRARTHLRIIARTDAVQSEGLEGAIKRANLYIEAGADVVFADAVTTGDAMRQFVKGVSKPFMANMTEFGRTPYFTAEQFESFGVKIVIWPVSSLRIAARAMEEMYVELHHKGTLHGMLDRMQTRADLYATIGYHSFEALDASIATSVVPDDVREAPVRNSQS